MTAGNVFPTTVQVASAAGFRSDPVLPFFLERYAAAYRAELDAFVRAVRGEVPACPNGEDGLRALLLANAAVESAATGRTVRPSGGLNMRIGLVTDGLPALSFEDLLRTAAELHIETLEFGCGNWSSAPHLDLDALLRSASARDAFMGRIAAHGLVISALNCSGNPLFPGERGAAHRAVTSKTIQLAGRWADGAW